MKKITLLFLVFFTGAYNTYAQIQLEVESANTSNTVLITSNGTSQPRTVTIERTEPLSSGNDLLELKVPVLSANNSAIIEAENIGGGVVYTLFKDGAIASDGTTMIGNANSKSSDELTILDIGSDDDVVLRMETVDHELVFGANPSNEGFIGTVSDSRMSFRTNNITRAIISKTGDFGVGTPGPSKKLHVRDDGALGERTTVAVLESVTSKQPQLLFSEGGTDQSSGMSIEYDGTLTGANNNLRINTSSGEVGLMVRNNGHVGIKGTPSNLAILRVNQQAGVPMGLQIVPNNGNNPWSITAGTSNSLQLAVNGSLRGSFNDTNGNYTPVSDRNLKSNITPLPNEMLAKVMELNPVSYTFKGQEGDKESIGRAGSQE